MVTVTFYVNLSAHQVLEYYKGVKNMVQVTTDRGELISVSYEILLKFLTHGGIKGKFKMTYKDNGKLNTIEKIG
jgi:hypothetical protein